MLKAAQRRERVALGPDYSDGGFVAADETGAPMRTDQLRRLTQRLMRETGMRQVRLYDARHSALTYLLGVGVPDVVVSAWAGHADLGMAKEVYAHPDATHLRGAAAAFNGLLPMPGSRTG